MSYHRIQQVTAWQQIPEHQNPCWQLLQWSAPVLLDQLTTWLLVTLVHGTQWHHQREHWRSGPRYSCTVSAQKNITVKADTLSHIYSHIQTELNNSKIENSPNFEYKYLTALSTGSKKSPVWPPQSRVCSAVAPHQQSTRDSSKQDSAERSKNMTWVPV